MPIDEAAAHMDLLSRTAARHLLGREPRESPVACGIASFVGGWSQNVRLTNLAVSSRVNR